MSIFDRMSEIPETKKELNVAQVEDELRRDLLLDVSCGKIKPEQAEATCKKLKYRPLQRLPATFVVDRDTLTMWTPEMVAIWFATNGNGKALHRHIPGNHEKTNWWRPNVLNDHLFGEPEQLDGCVNGYTLVNHEKTKLFESFIDFDGFEKRFPSIEAWYPQLQEYLRVGKIRATGYRITAEENIKEEIPHLYWTDAVFDTTVFDTLLTNGSGTEYMEVLFPASEVLACQQPSGAVNHWARWPKLNPLDKIIFSALKSKYIDAFPPYYTRKERDKLVRDAAGNALPARWNSKTKRTKDLIKAEAAFSRAMDRLFKKILAQTSQGR